MSQSLIIHSVQHWLTHFVIQHNICPFARREQQRNSIRFICLDSGNLQQDLEGLIVEADYLDNHAETETSLLIFPAAYQDFDDFLDLVAIADDLLIEQGYQGIYQLASFHPDYCFDGVSQDDASNYTNRSPYPILHLIREASIEQVLSHYPDPENIPLRNIALTRELGSNYLQALLNACHQSKPES